MKQHFRGTYSGGNAHRSGANDSLYGGPRRYGSTNGWHFLLLRRKSLATKVEKHICLSGDNPDESM